MTTKRAEDMVRDWYTKTSKDEQIRNLWRNRLGRRIERMSFVSLIALVLSIISLVVSLNIIQLIKQWLGN